MGHRQLRLYITANFTAAGIELGAWDGGAWSEDT